MNEGARGCGKEDSLLEMLGEEKLKAAGEMIAEAVRRAGLQNEPEKCKLLFDYMLEVITGWNEECISFGFHTNGCAMILVFKTNRELFDRILADNPHMCEITDKSGEFQKTFPEMFIAGMKQDQ